MIKREIKIDIILPEAVHLLQQRCIHIEVIRPGSAVVLKQD